MFSEHLEIFEANKAEIFPAHPVVSFQNADALSRVQRYVVNEENT